MSYFIHEARVVRYAREEDGWLVHDRFRMLPQETDLNVLRVAGTEAQARAWPIRTIIHYHVPYWRSARGQVRWHCAWAPVVSG